MTIDVVTSLNFTDTPTVNSVPIVTATPGTYGPININSDGSMVSGGGVTPTNQVVSFYSGEINAMSGATIIPSDNTTPSITEGTQVWAQTLTPMSWNSKFKFEQAFLYGSSSSNRNISFALFRNSTCIYAIGSNLVTSGRPLTITVYHVDQPNTTSSVTYSLRVGISSTATWYLGQAAANTITYGGTANVSTWSITEIL